MMKRFTNITCQIIFSYLIVLSYASYVILNRHLILVNLTLKCFLEKKPASGSSSTIRILLLSPVEYLLLFHRVCDIVAVIVLLLFDSLFHKILSILSEI